MTPTELLKDLTAKGIQLEPTSRGTLRIRAASPPDDVTYELIRQHKPALLDLLVPHRDPNEEDCPEHWLHIPMLPPKGSKADVVLPNGQGARYRVKLFGMWYIIRCEPTISETHVSTVDTHRKRRMFADLHEFYRWAWAEMYISRLTWRVVN